VGLSIHKNKTGWILVVYLNGCCVFKLGLCLYRGWSQPFQINVIDPIHLGRELRLGIRVHLLDPRLRPLL
jgi:hypothetical protein